MNKMTSNITDSSKVYITRSVYADGRNEPTIWYLHTSPGFAPVWVPIHVRERFVFRPKYFFKNREVTNTLINFIVKADISHDPARRDECHISYCVEVKGDHHIPVYLLIKEFDEGCAVSYYLDAPTGFFEGEE